MTQAIAGIILAGGRSRRMAGRDKSFIDLGGKPLIAHAVARLRPQVAALAINANADPAAFSSFGLPVIADTVADFQGPLAGFLAGMRWAATEGFPAIVTVAVDTPFFPRDLAGRLARAGGGEVIAVAASAGRLHPTFARLPVSLADGLARFIAGGDSRKVTDWLATQAVVPVAFDGDPPPLFFNVNTPADLDAAEEIFARHGLCEGSGLPESA
jgi:molybdopterin-guanine dinucleotide biosynthesis protein A